MVFPRVVLALAALMFGYLGVWLLVEPEALDELIGIVAREAAARTELRALYGGLEIGLAVFLALGVFRRDLAGAACLCLAIVMTGVGLARALGIYLDASGSSNLYLFLGSEVLFATLGFAGYVSAGRQRP